MPKPGRSPLHGVAAPAAADVRPRFAAATQSSTASINDYCWRLGRRHRLRDESAEQDARICAEGEQEWAGECRRRWPRVVTAMRTLIWFYNDGVGIEAVVCTEVPDSGEPAAQLIARGQTLTVTLDGTDICVRHGHGTTDSPRVERRVTFHRSDEATAAYVLQHWMTQL